MREFTECPPPNSLLRFVAACFPRHASPPGHLGVFTLIPAPRDSHCAGHHHVPDTKAAHRAQRYHFRSDTGSGLASPCRHRADRGTRPSNPVLRSASARTPVSNRRNKRGRGGAGLRAHEPRGRPALARARIAVTLARVPQMDALLVHTLARAPQMDALPVHTLTRVPQMDPLPVHTPARVSQLDPLATSLCRGRRRSGVASHSGVSTRCHGPLPEQNPPPMSRPCPTPTSRRFWDRSDRNRLPGFLQAKLSFRSTSQACRACRSFSFTGQSA